MATTKVLGSIQEYKMNPGGHDFYPMFKSDINEEVAARVYNQVLYEKIEFMKACSVAETEMFKRIENIFAQNGIERAKF
jgi:hypothetical protein